MISFIQSVFSDHNGTKWEINNRKTRGKISEHIEMKQHIYK